MTPEPHQIVGAKFLADRKTALLADAPRVGKTGACILGLDDIFAGRVLVVTTASGRIGWERAFGDWSAYRLPTKAIFAAPSAKDLLHDRVIISWGYCNPGAVGALVKQRWDAVVLDEAHYAKDWSAARTKGAYGSVERPRGGLSGASDVVWCLTGTPIANAANDLHPMLRSLAPERLAAQGDWPDVTSYDDFERRYCVVKQKKISRWNSIPVVVASRNLPELRARMEGFWLRRTQEDVGILTPIFETLPLQITARERARIEKECPPELTDIIIAAETGETRSLDMLLGPLRRLTGTLKANGVALTVKDEVECGLDKIVLMAWHTEVLDALQKVLTPFGCVRIDGSTSPGNRDKAVQSFRHDPATKVFLGQMIACGEAIDLSAAADLIFVESSFVPKDMAQASLRITNLGQKRRPRVRVAALAGSIDEALQTVLLRKVKDAKEVISR